MACMQRNGAMSVVLLLALAGSEVAAAGRVDLDYRVRFEPQQGSAWVRIELEKGETIRSLDFNLGRDGRYQDFKADGHWQQSEDGRGIWRPQQGKAVLSYRVQIDHQRANGRYDARITDDWVLMRGDDLVPAARLDALEGVQLVARMQVELPEQWPAVETGWPRIGKQKFRIDNPSRNFDRPTGWLLAGKLGTRRARLGNTDVTIAAPKGEGVRRMDMLTLLTYLWPQAQAVFAREPSKLLIVSAGDPFWRGGLSGPNSLYMHADRPLVSENGTSSLAHELVHVLSRIRARDRSDWITEGVAEYYAIELLRRSGGVSDDRLEKLNQQLTRWSRKVGSLRTDRSTGEVTARSVLLLQALDVEIRERTKGRQSLDDVTRGLMRLDRVSTEDFVAITENVLGGASKVLDSRLLR